MLYRDIYDYMSTHFFHESKLILLNIGDFNAYVSTNPSPEENNYIFKPWFDGFWNLVSAMKEIEREVDREWERAREKGEYRYI